MTELSIYILILAMIYFISDYIKLILKCRKLKLIKESLILDETIIRNKFSKLLKEAEYAYNQLHNTRSELNALKRTICEQHNDSNYLHRQYTTNVTDEDYNNLQISESKMPLMTGVELIARERARQKVKFGIDNDKGYKEPELVYAACAYSSAFDDECPVPPCYPWPIKTWNPGNRIKNLTKAGALIAAEIDRISNND